MEPSQELMSTLTSLDKLVNYVQTHELHTILIAVGVLLLPFIVRTVFWGILRIFSWLVQLFFKDQIKDFLRGRICSVLQHYLDESIVIGDLPQYQSNMITLYRLHWTHGNYSADINRVEVMTEVGGTLRKYAKLWFKHLFSDFDYLSAKKDLFCNCIKDVRFYRAEVDVAVPEQGGTTDVKLLPSGKEVLKKSFTGLEELRKLNISIATESSEVRLHVAGEEFRFQNFSGKIENAVEAEGSKCSVHFGCVYDGENISIDSTDHNLQSFRVVISDIYFSDKIWRVICAYCKNLPQNLEVRDGKLLDIRANLVVNEGKLALEHLTAKMDEGQFVFGDCHVDDLEISLVSQNLEYFEIKKAVARVNDVIGSFKGTLHLQENLLETEKAEIRYGKNVAVVYKAWLDLQTLDHGHENVHIREVDVKLMVQGMTKKISEWGGEKLSGLREKLNFFTKKKLNP